MYYGRDRFGVRERRLVGDVRRLLQARRGMLSEAAVVAGAAELEAVAARLERLRDLAPEVAERVSLGEEVEEERRLLEVETAANRLAAVLERVTLSLSARRMHG